MVGKASTENESVSLFQLELASNCWLLECDLFNQLFDDRFPSATDGWLKDTFITIQNPLLKQIHVFYDKW